MLVKIANHNAPMSNCLFEMHQQLASCIFEKSFGRTPITDTYEQPPRNQIHIYFFFGLEGHYIFSFLKTILLFFLAAKATSSFLNRLDDCTQHFSLGLHGHFLHFFFGHHFNLICLQLIAHHLTFFLRPFFLKQVLRQARMYISNKK